MTDEDLMNDALDGRIQQAVQQSRSNTLHGMSGGEHGPQDPDSANEYAEGLKGIAGETEEEDEKKKNGLDIGSIAGAVGSMIGG